MVKVEYLVAIDVRSGLCKNIDGLKSLLMSNDRIVFQKSKLKFDNDIEVTCKFIDGEVTLGVLKYYHLCFETSKSNIQKLNELCREVRSILSKVSENGMVQTLWDGVGLELSQQAYPIIYEIENTLRKLLSKFMLSKVGLSWHKQSIPKEVKESIRTPGEKETTNCLYEADFIQLSSFLFRKYSRKEVTKYLDELSKRKLDEKIELKDLDDYIPRSNWERYFSEILSSEQAFIENRWEKIYELRCKVAHNKTFTFADLEELKRLVGELLPKFEEAIQNLEKVNVPEDEKEQVAESVAKFRSETYGHYLENYLTLNKDLYNLTKLKIPTIELKFASDLMKMSKALEANNVFNSTLTKNLKDIQNIRNTLVHNFNFDIPDSVIKRNVQLMNNIRAEIKEKAETENVEQPTKEATDDEENCDT